MDAMHAMVSGEGCTVDGTAATRNPVSQFVNNALGGMEQGKNSQRLPPQGFQGAGPQGQHGMDAIDRGMAAGMGVRQMPRGAPQMNAQGNAFIQEFEQFRQSGGVPPGAMMGPRGPMAQGPMHGGPTAWVDDFQRMNIGPQPSPQQMMESAYKDSFHHPHQMADRWANRMIARGPRGPTRMDQAWKGAAPQSRADGWAKELSAPAQSPQVEELTNEMNASEEFAEAPDAAATRQATDDMVNLLSSDARFKDSKFFDFMSKVSTGELTFENNTVVEHPEKAGLTTSLEHAWKEAQAPANTLDAAWQDQAKTDGIADATKLTMEEAFSKAWNETSLGEDGAANMEQFMKAFENLDPAELQASAGITEMDKAWTQPGEIHYEMHKENPFFEDENSYELGLKYFREGQLQDAILAFEATVQREPSHADAWRMLGVTHQENDQDPKAIACLERAVEQDAYHLDALLGLGVSYVNELKHDQALKNLKAWVTNNPNFQGLEVTQDAYSDGSLVDDVMQLMLKAQEWAPHDADVQEVLGVLYNVSRDYESAVNAFRTALSKRPDDYALWNKLGATLANGAKSEEAVPVYHRALELKPKYARGWLNLGISHSNLGSYEESARCYLKAMELNPTATHIWGHLRIAFTCMDRFDLITLAENRDIDVFRKEFNF